MDKKFRTDDLQLQSYLWNLLTINKKIIFSYLQNKDETKMINEMFNNEEHGRLLQKEKYLNTILNDLTKTQEILEFFLSLGYIDSKEDLFYVIKYSVQNYHYHPFITPNGNIDLPGQIFSYKEIIVLSSQEYNKFLNQVKDFKSSVESGLYHTIFYFNYEIVEKFNSLVYEVKNKYFDTIYFFKPNECSLVAPMNIPDKGNLIKKWRGITKKEADPITLDDFYNKDIIDSRIDRLEWKRDRDGMIVFKGRAYWLKKDGEYENYHDYYERNILGIPDFLDRGIFSIENYISRIYEDSVGQYLHIQHGYDTRIRYKPNYLDGKEIDVFGEKISPRTFTVCECKLRLNDNPITLEEINYFYEKKEIIIKKERRSQSDKFYFWFITNTDKISEEVNQLAKQYKIDLKIGELPSNWKTRSDWSINIKPISKKSVSNTMS